MPARHLRYVRISLKAFRDDPGPFLRRPSSPALAPRNHLNTLISVAFVPGFIPGIKHRSCTEPSPDIRAPAQISLPVRSRARWDAHAAYDHPNHVVEMALAHAVGSKVEAAYRPVIL